MLYYTLIEKCILLCTGSSSSSSTLNNSSPFQVGNSNYTYVHRREWGGGACSWKVTEKFQKNELNCMTRDGSTCMNFY